MITMRWSKLLKRATFEEALDGEEFVAGSMVVGQYREYCLISTSTTRKFGIRRSSVVNIITWLKLTDAKLGSTFTFLK